MEKSISHSPSSYVGEVMAHFNKAVGYMQIQLPDSGRVLIEKWLEFFNSWKGRRVTGFETAEQLAVKLLADSFAVSYAEKSSCEGGAMDLGSGNGWPGLALSALGLCKRLSLLDSRLGACDFLNTFIHLNDLPHFNVIHERAEEAGRNNELREKYVLVVTRAMAAPGIALEMCSGLLSVGGKALLWLGPEQIVPKNRSSLSSVGLMLKKEIPYNLPYGMGKRVLAVYLKTNKLKAKYPRRYATISRNPLI